MILASVIIPAWGEENLLHQCLNALEHHTEAIEVIVVDNGMGWDIDADVVIRNPENLCYAVACNQGAAVSSANTLVMLNVDAFVQSGWLYPLLDALNDEAVAAAGPRITHPDGSLQTSGIATFHGGGSAGGQELKDDGPSRDVDGVTGACMAIKRDVYLSLGGMHEGYWAGNEDVDLCLTMREAGYRIRYVSESHVQHIEGASGAARWVKVHENVALLNQRWAHR